MGKRVNLGFVRGASAEWVFVLNSALPEGFDTSRLHARVRTGSDWSALGCSVDTDTNTITLSIDSDTSGDCRPTGAVWELRLDTSKIILSGQLIEEGVPFRGTDERVLVFGDVSTAEVDAVQPLVPASGGGGSFDFAAFLTEYPPIVRGALWPGFDAPAPGDAFAFVNDGGAISLAIATTSGITDFPDGSLGTTAFEVDGNGWLIVGTASNTPVQLRQHSDSPTGHADTYPLGITIAFVGLDSAPDDSYDLTASGLSGNVTVTPEMSVADIETALNAATAGTPSIVLGGVDSYAIYSGSLSSFGIANDLSSQNPTITSDVVQNGFPAPLGSIMQLLGFALDEGHAFIRDNNGLIGNDPLTGWNELAVTRFTLSNEWPDDPVAVGQGTAVVTVSQTIVATYSRQGRIYGEVHLVGTVSISGVTDPDAPNDVTIDFGAMLATFLPFSYLYDPSGGGGVVGHYSVDGAFAGESAGAVGHLVTTGGGSTMVKLVSASDVVLGTESLANDDSVEIDVRALITND